MRIRLLPLLLILLLVAPGLVSCSKSEKSPAATAQKSESSGKIIDPLTLITQEEAAQALGEPAKPAEFKDTKNPLGQKLVLFNAASDTSFKLLQLSFIQNEGMSKEKLAAGYNAKQLYTDTRKMMNDATDLTGLGDQAFWIPSGLHVLKGNVYFTITMNNLSKDDNLEKAKVIAQKVLSRL